MFREFLPISGLFLGAGGRVQPLKIPTENRRNEKEDEWSRLLRQAGRQADRPSDRPTDRRPTADRPSWYQVGTNVRRNGFPMLGEMDFQF